MGASAAALRPLRWLGTLSGGSLNSFPSWPSIRAPYSNIGSRRSRYMATSRRSDPVNTDLLTCLSAEPPASRSLSLASVEAWQMDAVTWRSNFFAWLTAFGPVGWFGRTSLVSCRRTEEGILVPSSGAWSNSGMGSPTECWTLSTSEWTGLDGLSLKDDGVCSLSDILETGPVPQRYFLTQRACAGILRRAEKRKRELPEPLRLALAAVAARMTTTPEPGTLSPEV